MILSLSYDEVLSRVRINATGLDVLNSNPNFETNANGWAPSQATFARSLEQAHEGVASGKLTPNGVGAIVSVELNAASAVAVEPDQSYTLSGWFFSPTGWGEVSITVVWLDVANVAISSPPGTIVDLASSVWTNLTETVVAPAGAVRGSIRARMAGTPTAADVLYIDQMNFGAATVTVERSTDGIRWTTVRGGADLPVVGGVASLDDYEFDSGSKK